MMGRVQQGEFAEIVGGDGTKGMRLNRRTGELLQAGDGHREGGHGGGFGYFGRGSKRFWSREGG